MKTWPFVAAYALLMIAGAVGLAFAYVALATHHGRPSPLKAHAPCQKLVDGPTKLYACSDGRGYVFTDGRWHDAGRMTPAPWTPAY